MCKGIKIREEKNLIKLGQGGSCDKNHIKDFVLNKEQKDFFLPKYKEE